MDRDLNDNAWYEFLRNRQLLPSSGASSQQGSSSGTTSNSASRRGIATPPRDRAYSEHTRGTFGNTSTRDSHGGGIASGSGGSERPPAAPSDSALGSNRKQYRCEICQLPFGRKHHKERHVANIHRQERPFVCDKCGFAFHQKPNLDRHRATVHQETRQFACSDCDQRFSRRRELLNHRQTVHDHQGRMCPHCRQYFNSTRELAQHIRYHHRHN